MATQALFRDDAYLATADATVVAITDAGAIVLDRTIFYATSGGQPGDTGRIVRANGDEIAIAATVTGETKDDILHLPAPGQAVPAVGEKVTLSIDWERRLKLMRMHTACHLLSVVCPFPITGASVSEDDSRVDLDIPDPKYTKEFVTERIMELVLADYPVFISWITDDEFAANPGLVKSKNVRPPVGLGRIRLVNIGDSGSIDSQPCGGTHVARTLDVGEIHIGKIDKKGRENRRFRIRFGPAPVV